MKLIIAVVRDELASLVSQNLTRSGFRATKLASTGGFLRAGNSTFLIGVPVAELDAALQVLRDACRNRKGPQPAVGSADAEPAGATVFVLSVNSMVKV